MILFRTFYFIVFISIAYAAADHDGIIRIPLTKMESGLRKLLRKGLKIKTIETLYDIHRRAAWPGKVVLKDGKPVPTNDTLPLFKYFDTEYYGLVNIGKPGKVFKMVMDTAWAYSWVPSVDCPATSIGCARHEKYNHKQSSTYIPDGRPFNITSGESSYTGYMSKDSFLVGQMYSLNQTFAELTHLPWINSLFESDGTIGLAFKELSPNYMPFFYNFYTQNKLRAPIFAFYVNRDPTTKRGGSIFFGGIDPKHNKTEFTTIQVKKQSFYWLFQMDKVSLIFSKKSHQDFCVNGCDAYADTSSNVIIGPKSEITEINRLIGAQEIFFSNRYLIPCANELKGPKVNFTINGKPFQILARDYIQKLSYSGITVCLSAFQPAEPSYTPNTWGLGGAFLYQYYTAYDMVNRQILIAEAA